MLPLPAPSSSTEREREPLYPFASSVREERAVYFFDVARFTNIYRSCPKGDKRDEEHGDDEMMTAFGHDKRTNSNFGGKAHIPPEGQIFTRNAILCSLLFPSFHKQFEDRRRSLVYKRTSLISPHFLSFSLFGVVRKHRNVALPGISGNGGKSTTKLESLHLRQIDPGSSAGFPGKTSFDQARKFKLRRPSNPAHCGH